MTDYTSFPFHVSLWGVHILEYITVSCGLLHLWIIPK